MAGKQDTVEIENYANLGNEDRPSVEEDEHAEMAQILAEEDLKWEMDKQESVAWRRQRMKENPPEEVLTGRYHVRHSALLDDHVVIVRSMSDCPEDLRCLVTYRAADRAVLPGLSPAERRQVHSCLMPESREGRLRVNCLVQVQQDASDCPAPLLELDWEEPLWPTPTDFVEPTPYESSYPPSDLKGYWKRKFFKKESEARARDAEVRHIARRGHALQQVIDGDEAAQMALLRALRDALRRAEPEWQAVRCGQGLQCDERSHMRIRALSLQSPVVIEAACRSHIAWMERNGESSEEDAPRVVELRFTQGADKGEWMMVPARPGPVRTALVEMAAIRIRDLARHEIVMSPP